MAPRYFTAEQANAVLAEVRPLAEQMVEHAGQLAEARRRQEELATHIAGNGGDIAPADLADAEDAVEREANALADAIERIQAAGAQVKDIERGLLDFPARADVLLCWHLGEDEVGYWHSPEDGFAGRKPLPFE